MRAIQNILQEGFHLNNIDTTNQTISTMWGFLSLATVLLALTSLLRPNVKEANEK